MTTKALGQDRFMLWAAIACLVIAFGGFTPTYWAKLATHSFSGAPILHIHGLIFFSWTLLFVLQASLIAKGNFAHHRAWGLLGISLATAMSITIALAVLDSNHLGAAMGKAAQALQFSIVSWSALVLFIGFFATAIAKARDPELHQRLMLLAMIPLMQAAIARVYKLLVAPPGVVGPPRAIDSLIPGLAADLIIVWAIVHDHRQGKIHRVYPIGLALILATQFLMVPASLTETWMTIAIWLNNLAG